MPPQPPGHLLGQFQKPGSQGLPIVDVRGECRLVRDRLCFTIGDDPAIVDAMCKLPQMLAMAAEVAGKRLKCLSA